MEDDTVPGSTLPDTLDYQEEKAAIPSLGFMDVVGYDGCNMSAIEILTVWHGHATVVTGSQEYVGWEGLQYDLVLPQMNANPLMTADQVAVAFSQSATADKTWAAVAVDSRFNALGTAVHNLSAAFSSGLAANRKKYDQAFTATQSFWQAPMDKDLYDMASKINGNVTDANIKSKSQAVMNAVAAVVLDDHNVNAYSSAHGITSYHISKATPKDLNYTYYRSTVDFPSKTSWGEFLDA